MNFVYFIWATKQGHHQNINVTNKELCVSALSIRKHMPGNNIYIYTSKQDGYQFDSLKPFMDKYDIRLVYAKERDLNDSYFNKILWFREAVDNMSDFVFMDTDATFIKPMPALVNVPLRFSRFIKGRSKPFTPVQMKFIKKYFGIKENYTYFRSTVVWVDQNATKSFPWQKFKTALDDIIKVFKSRIEKEVPHRAKNRKQFYMDELFFSMAIHKIGLKVSDFGTPNLKDYNQYILPDWGLGVKNKEFMTIHNEAKKMEECKQFFV